MKLGPVCDVEDFLTLDDGEILLGYLDAIQTALWPKTTQSRSYWHGWRNGMIDAGQLAPDEAHLKLEAEFAQIRDRH